MNVAAGSGGGVHLAGQVIGGRLRVIQRLAGTPWRWQCVCTVCGTQQVQKHDVLMTGWPKCLNSSCGKRQQTADDDFRRERARERQQEAERQKQLQAEADRKARIEAANKAQADAVAARRKQEVEAAERAKAIQKSRWESETALKAREEIFAKYNLSPNQIREVMNDPSITLEDFGDIDATHVEFLAIKISNRDQRGNR